MKWFKNLNAIPKIMLAAGGMLFFLLTMGFLALGQISQLNELTIQIFNRDVGGIGAIEQAEVDRALMSRNLATAALSQGNGAAVGFAENDFGALIMDLRTSLTIAYSRSVRANLRDQLQSAQSALPAVEAAAHEFFARAKTPDRAATASSLKAALVSADQLGEVVHQAAVIKRANIELFKANQGAFLGHARTQYSWLLAGAFVFVLAASLIVGHSFSDPLKQAVSALNLVREGDFTQRLKVESNNEIGQLGLAMNAALENVCDVMVQVSGASRSLTSASSQLAKSADVMAGGAHEQAASLEQTSASLEQITATVRQNSDNARQASQFALSSRDSAEKGGTVVHTAINAMNEINEASSQIAAIIRVIDEIAFQTNLLAVNASVEAARAREHGKGFAVVANEIRTLAQRSGSAAKEIKALISDSRRKVEKGSNLVNHSGQTLTEIVASVKRVTDIVGEIAAASREQSVGIEQVNSAMLQMDSVMQSNSSQTEELSATANTLAANALHLEKLISRFTVSSDRTIPSVSYPTPLPYAPQIDPAPGASADLAGLASNVGQQASIAALDEEFEEF